MWIAQYCVRSTALVSDPKHKTVLKEVEAETICTDNDEGLGLPG